MSPVERRPVRKNIKASTEEYQNSYIDKGKSNLPIGCTSRKHVDYLTYPTCKQRAAHQNILS